jgi:hypothetical protein
MQQQQYETTIKLQNCDNMLQAYAKEKVDLEEQVQGFIDLIKRAHQTTCDLELKNRKLEHELAKERQQLSKQPDEKQC